MMNKRSEDYKAEFIALLKRLARARGGTDDLQQVLDTAYEDPAMFLQDWLQPLLLEGMNPEEALSMVVEGTLQPN